MEWEVLDVEEERFGFQAAWFNSNKDKDGKEKIFVEVKK